MNEDIKKLNAYASGVFSSILAQNPNAFLTNRDWFVAKSFEIAQRMMGLEERKTTLTVEIPDEGENGAARRVQEKLLRDIERSLGLKADAADPLTLAGRLDAIKRALGGSRGSTLIVRTGKTHWSNSKRGSNRENR